MKITVKQLQGGECSVEVSPETTVSEIKREVARKLRIGIDEQKLLLLGRTLADDQTVRSYPALKDGTKLNLVVKKPEGLLEASIKYFKGIGMSDAQAKNAGNDLVRGFEDKLYKMSWDDLERLCYSIMVEENGTSQLVQPTVESEPECEDSFTL